MGLTDLGFDRPTYDELLEAQIERAKELFGEDIDTNESTPLGKYIRLNVTDLADCYEILEKIYYARFPHSATGTSLDRLCPFAGISRNQASYATHTVVFTGVAGEYVPEGFEVSTTDGSVAFHTYDELLIGEDGTVEAEVECETAGEIGNVATGKIDTIVSPDANVESVTHLGIIEYGEELESDMALRQRFDESISGAGSSTVAAISGAISRVPLVDGVTVVENDTDVAVDGIPPHSFECFVLAPESQDTLIAEAIFNKKPLGIKAHGEVEVEILDEGGSPHIVKFSRTVQVSVYVKMTISTNTFFESDGVTQIKDNVAACINKLKNGEDVYLPSLYNYIFKTTGVVNVPSLTMCTNGENYSTNNIEVTEDKVARISTANIEVVVMDE